MSASSCRTDDSWSQVVGPWLLMWKVRLPLIALPVLAGLRRLSGRNTMVEPSMWAWQAEFALLCFISTTTGYFHLPFSVTWWLVLIVAFALETECLLGVATVLSLSVLLGWYGSLIRYPHSICALWGGARGLGKVGNIPLELWRAWDVLAHGLPAVLILLWNGPRMDSPGTVSVSAVAMALPLTMLWLWGVGLGLGKPWGVQLADTNAAYCVVPALPEKAWLWVHGSHWGVCALWGSLLVVPSSCVSYALVPSVLLIWHLFATSFLREDLLHWRAAFFIVTHTLAVMGAWKASTHTSALRLWVEVIVGWMVGGWGITCGAHRLWSHRSYVARLPFRIVLMLLNSFANQGTIYHWARDHRAHHKHTDTPADPHDATRGFFFAHIGWLLVPKHPDVKARGDTIPCSDLLADPVVAFQKKAEELFLFNELVSFVLPAVYGNLVWEDASLGFLVHGMLRWILCLNATWCVNSVAHFFGENSYDENASPRESLFTALVADGEGWHSYHHKYPWDYATAELGAHRRWNPSKLFIDFGWCLGQVSDCKRADHIARRTRCPNEQ